MADALSTIFLGLVVGSVYALAGTGLVLTYRISGVYNFAQGGIGMFFAYLYFQLNEGGSMNLLFGHYTQTWKLPSVVALILVVAVIAPAFGWMLDAVLFRRLRDQSTVVKIVATIGVLIALQGAAALIWGGTQTLKPNWLFPQHVFSAGGVLFPEQHLLTLVLLGALFLPIRWPVTPDRPPPAPKRPPSQATFRQRSGRVGLIAAAMIVPALFATQEWRGYIAGVPGMALIFLSLVLLAGYAGQISLGQAALAGFGAMIAAHLVTDHGWPFLFAALAGGLVTVPLGALLAFRATRLSPLFLGFATLAFGALMDQLAFSNIHFSNGLTGVSITRPSR